MQSQQCSAAEKGKVAENWAWGEGPELDLEEKAKKEKKSVAQGHLLSSSV